MLHMNTMTMHFCRVLDKVSLLVVAVMILACTGTDAKAAFGNWSSAGPVGKVHSLSVATGGSPIYAGGNGAIYKSTDNANSWSLSLAGPVVALGNGIVFKPGGTTTAYAAASEGVYKTSDSGASWSLLSGSPANGHGGLAVDAANPNDLYVATSAGIFKSGDGGTTWNDITSGITMADITAMAVYGTTLYAGTASAGVWSRPTGSGSWTNISNVALATSTISYLAVDPTGKVYALSGNSIYSTNDNGTTDWATDKSFPTGDSPVVLLIDTAATLYAGVVGTSNPGIFKSTDSGANWFLAGTGINTMGNCYALALQPDNHQIVYAGQFNLIRKTDTGFNNYMTIQSVTAGLHLASIKSITEFVSTYYAGGGEGVWTSSDLSYWNLTSFTGPRYQQVTALATDSGISSVLAGISKLGSFQSYKYFNASWTGSTNKSGGGTGTDVAAMASTPSNTYMAVVGDGVYWWDNGNNGWQFTGTAPGNTNITGLAASETNLYVSTMGGGIYRSTNAGSSWGGPTTPPSSSNIGAIRSSADGSVLLAGTADGATSQLFKSIDAGGIWTPGAILPSDITAIDIYSIPSLFSTAIIGTKSSGVFITFDGGMTVQPYTGGLPAYGSGFPQVNTVRFGSAVPEQVLIGLDGAGLYKRTITFPNISLTPTSHDFGNTGVPSSTATKGFTITNSGSTDLTISSITFTQDANFAAGDGSNLAYGDCPVGSGTLNPGASCTFNLSLNIANFGVKSGKITVATNDPVNPALTATVVANGVNTLTVNKTGTGSGSVVADTGVINCGAVCSDTFTSATTVTLTATASSGSGFVEWTGDCAGTGTTCQVTMDAVKTVSARFNIPTTINGATYTSGNTVTWTLANSPYYLTAGITVNAGATLIIEPGVIVKSNASSFAVYGTLTAQGTANSRIHFTDYRDDSVGGDTNGDGNTAVPAFTNWGGINVYANGTASIDRSDINYSGGSSAAVYKAGAGALSITNSTILNTHYWYEGIYLDSTTGPITISGNTINNGGTNFAYDGIYVKNAGSSATISANTIQNCRWHGINLYNSSPTISGNSISGSGEYGLYVNGTSLPTVTADNTFSGNAYGYMAFDVTSLANAHVYDSVFPGQPVIVDYIGGQGSMSVAANATWRSERSYYFKSGVYVNNGITLTIQSATNKDVITKWAGSALSVNGNLQVIGTAAHKIYFTDYRDDSIGGDSNGDGPSTVPAASGWPGIWVNANGTANITYSDIRYGGSSNGAVYKTGAGTLSLTNSSIVNSHYWGEGIYIDATTDPVTISNNTIIGGGANNAYDGIYIRNAGTSVTLSGNLIQNNRQEGIAIKNSSPTISGNTISGNSYYGIYIVGSSAPNITADNIFSSNSYGFMAFDVPAVANAHSYDAAFPGQPVLVDYVGGAGSATVATNTQWQSERTYYFLTSPYVNSGVTLTIQSATNKDIVTKWPWGTALTVAGNLVVQGSATHRVYFTDYRDDSIGGDTNGNGTANGPGAGQWQGLIINDGASATIDYAMINYAGWNGKAIYKTGTGSVSVTNSIIDRTSSTGIYLDATAATHTISGNTIQNSTNTGIYFNNAGSGSTVSQNIIQSNSSYGIYLTGASSTPLISRNTITDNPVGIYITASASPVIGGSAANANNLYNNITYSVQNTSTIINVDATYNWWGIASGPYHAATNTAGNPASKVTDYVNYGSYLAAGTLPGAPVITAATPADPTPVSTSAAITATFNEAMDPLTIDPATFLVAGVTGTVTYDGPTRTATFTPTSPAPLANGTTYTVTVKGGSSGAKDLSGTPLATDYSYSFTTDTPCVSPPSGLISWWKGEGNTNDQSGTNNGVLMNGATFAPGKSGQAFSFNGVNSYVDAGSSPVFEITDDVTVEAWVKTTTVDGGFIAGKWSYINDAHQSFILMHDGGNAAFQVNGPAGSTDLWVHGVKNISDGQWHHVAGTFSKTGGANNQKLYVDGVLDNQATTPAGGMYAASGWPLAIGGGAEATSGGNFFNGQIDEVRVFNRALSAAEIQAIYNSGSNSVCTIPVIALSPASYDFGTVPVSGNASWPVTISNTGSGQLNVSGIMISGTDYSLDLNDGGSPTKCGIAMPSLPPGTSCTVAVKISPASLGILSGTLTVTSNDPVFPTISSSFTGTGISVDFTPPTDGTLSAMSYASSQIYLYWSGFSDAGSGLATTNTYKLVRTDGTTIPPADCNAGTVVYQGSSSYIYDSFLTPNTTYAYRVCATDVSGNVSTGATATTTTLQTFTLTATTAGSGGAGGTVSPTNGVFDAGSYTYVYAYPDANSVFDFWSGDCSGTYASAYVYFDANKNCIANFAPLPAPQVIVTEPLSNEKIEDVTNVSISANFNVPLLPESVSATTFVVKDQNGAAVAGSVTYDSYFNQAIFTPTALLAGGATYTATLTTGIQNAIGQPLAADYSWNFTVNPYLGGVASEGNLLITPLGDGRIGVYRYISGVWQEQIFGWDSKGSRLQIGTTGTTLGYFGNGTAPTQVSNSQLSSSQTKSEWLAGNIRIVQELTYQPGAVYYGLNWKIANEDVADMSDLRFFHGEDTYFLGSDQGAGFWDAPNNTVGVQRTYGTDLRRMSLQAITAPYAYDSEYYGDMSSNVSAGALPNTINPSESTDNGYALEWSNPTLAAGSTWTISAFEKFADVPIGAVFVTAPVTTTCDAGTTCSLTYTVTNSTTSPANVTLTLTPDQAGWSATTSSTSFAVGTGGSQQVAVQLTIPAGVADGLIGHLTLFANDGTATANDTAAIHVRNIGVPTITLSPLTYNFGTVPVSGNASWPVTISNTGTSQLNVSGVTMSGTDYSLDLNDGGSPTKCGISTPSLPPGSSCTVAVKISPTSLGTLSGSLTVTSNDPVTPTISSAFTTLSITGGQVITGFAPPTTVTYGSSPITLSATASSGLPVAFSVVSGSGSISGSVLTITGAGTINLKASQAGDTSYSAAADVTASIVVSPAPLTVTGLTAVSRQYDGTTSATLSGGTLSGIIGTDTVSINSLTGSFNDKKAGVSKPVTVSATIGGANAGNYTITQPTGLTGNITQRTLTVTASGISKTYDGNNAATVSYGDDRLAGDILAISGSAAFSNKTAGINKSVFVTGIAITGADAANYSLATTSAGTVANITPRPLTVSVSCPDKTYDGSMTATVNLSDNRITGDILTASYSVAAFADKSSGLSKPVSVTGIAVTGTDAANYTLTAASVTATANITAATLTVTGLSASSKVYDGLPGATLSGGILSGIIGSDDVTVAGSSGAFTDKNAGSGKPVTVSSVILAGVDAGNYTVTNPAGISSDITPAPLVITANSLSKIYGQTYTFNGSEFTATGLQNGETIGSVTLACPGDDPAATVSGGPYPVTASSATGGTFNPANYAIAYKQGLLTVTQSTVTITASATAGGTITLAGTTTVSLGANQTYTITPSAGYYLSDLKVDGISQGTQSSYTFSSVAASHTIEAQFFKPDGVLDPTNTTGAPRINDAMIALTFALGVATPTPEQLRRCDAAPMVNSIPHPDGKIDLADVLIVLRRVVGLTN